MRTVTIARKALRSLFLADILSVATATALAGFLGTRIQLAALPLLGRGAMVTPPLVVALWLIALRASGTRDPLIVLTGVEYYRRAISATLRAFGALGIVGFLIDLRAARPYVLFGLPLGLLFTLFFRWVVRQRLLRHRRRGAAGVRALVIVDDVNDENLGPLSDFLDVVASHQVGEVGEIATLAVNDHVDVVVVRTQRLIHSQWLQALSWQLDLHHITLLVDAASGLSISPRMAVIPLRSRTLLAIAPLQLASGSHPLKRLLDLAGALLLLLIGAPLVVVAAVAIYLTDRGPIFFTQERIGFAGRTFRLHKLRTMITAADQLRPELVANTSASNGLFKLPDDPRLTRVGRVLRRFSLDEWPQLWNVVRGEMSLVGPRPRLPSEMADDPYAGSRTRVRPGLTGLWQVSGRSDLGAEETATLDLMYIDQWSLTSDLVILLRTFKAVLTGRGAY